MKFQRLIELKLDRKWLFRGVSPVRGLLIRSVGPLPELLKYSPAQYRRQAVSFMARQVLFRSR